MFARGDFAAGKVRNFWSLFPYEIFGKVCYNKRKQKERVLRMYQVGMQVVYGAHGVCRILCMEDRVIDRKKISYYVLQPVEQEASRFYVPAHNENALSKMRPLVTRERLLELLTSDGVREDAWIEDENRRKQYYRQLISSIDLEAMIRMIHSLRRHRTQTLQAGKKVHLCDENFLQDAQRVLRSELCTVLDMPMQEMEAYLQTLVGQ